MFEPSDLAVRQLAKIREEGVTKEGLIQKMYTAGFTHITHAVSPSIILQLIDGLEESAYEGCNPCLWVCTDNSTVIPKTFPTCLIGEELLTFIGIQEETV